MGRARGRGATLIPGGISLQDLILRGKKKVIKSGCGRRGGETRTLCGHQVFVGFARKDGEEVEDVEKEVLVGMRHRMDEPLVCRDDRLLIVRLFCCPNQSGSGTKKKRNISPPEHVPIASRNYVHQKPSEWTRGQENNRRVPGSRGHMVSRAPK